MFRPLALALAVLLAAGCGDHAGHDHGEPAGPAADAEHHDHAAPHGGTLVELGEHEANLELRLDPATGRLDLWILGAHATEAIRTAQPALTLQLTEPAAVAGPLELLPVASTLTGETAGDTSQFAVTDERLTGLAGLAGTVTTVEIRGRRFSDVAFRLP